MGCSVVWCTMEVRVSMEEGVGSGAHDAAVRGAAPVWAHSAVDDVGGMSTWCRERGSFVPRMAQGPVCVAP